MREPLNPAAEEAWQRLQAAIRESGRAVGVNVQVAFSSSPESDVEDDDEPESDWEDDGESDPEDEFEGEQDSKDSEDKFE